MIGQDYIAHNGGFIDMEIRAETEADWVQAAVFYGLLEPGEDGEMLALPGVNVDMIGPVVVDPGDPETGEGMVIDSRLHINLRLAGPAIEATDETGAIGWQRMIEAWVDLGDPDPNINASEDALVLLGVALIRPDSIGTPVRSWA